MAEINFETLMTFITIKCNYVTSSISGLQKLFIEILQFVTNQNALVYL